MFNILEKINYSSRRIYEIDPDTALLDGPSVSGLTSVSCALGTASVVGTCINSEETLSIETQTRPAEGEHTPLLEESNTTQTENVQQQEQQPNDNGDASTKTITTTTITTTTIQKHHHHQQQPTSPNSTTSTAPLISPPVSPNATTFAMPSKTAHSTHKQTKTTTITKAEVIDQDNRFAILDDDPNDVIELERMRRPAAHEDELSLQMNSLPDLPQTPSSSSVTTRSSSSPRSPSNNSDSTHSSPAKKKHRHRNHNNNQPQVITDLNSIESIHEEAKVPDGPLDWIDELIKDAAMEQEKTENGTVKSKNRKQRSAKDMDQLDGVSKKSAGNASVASSEDDEKLATCLHYTLMCCDCAIS